MQSVVFIFLNVIEEKPLGVRLQPAPSLGKKKLTFYFNIVIEKVILTSFLMILIRSKSLLLVSRCHFSAKICVKETKDILLLVYCSLF